MQCSLLETSQPLPCLFPSLPYKASLRHVFFCTDEVARRHVLLYLPYKATHCHVFLYSLYEVGHCHLFLCLPYKASHRHVFLYLLYETGHCHVSFMSLTKPAITMYLCTCLLMSGSYHTKSAITIIHVSFCTYRSKSAIDVFLRLPYEANFVCSSYRSSINSSSRRRSPDHFADSDYRDTSLKTYTHDVL